MKFIEIVATCLLWISGGLCDAEAGFPQPFLVPSPVNLQARPVSFVPIVPILPFPTQCQNKGSVQLGSKCIFVESTSLSWNEANRYCGQLGYKLTEITSGEDYFKLISYLRSRGLSKYSYWVGAAKISNLFWQWVSQGIPLHTTFWAVTFVNGKGVKEPIDDSFKTCGLLDARRSHFLNTESCQARYGFICEKDLAVGPIIPRPRPQPWWPTFFGGEDGESNCPDGWEYDIADGKCYFFVKGDLQTFEDAKTACEAKDAELVTILSQDQNTFLTSVYNENEDDGDLWIGLFSDPMGIFFWLNSDPLDYTNWAAGHPVPPFPSCGTINYADGEWTAHSCADTKGYICEKEADSEEENE